MEVVDQLESRPTCLADLTKLAILSELTVRVIRIKSIGRREVPDPDM